MLATESAAAFQNTGRENLPSSCRKEVAANGFAKTKSIGCALLHEKLETVVARESLTAKLPLYYVPQGIVAAVQQNIQER